MLKTAVSPNFKAHQLGDHIINDKYYRDNTFEKKKNFSKNMIKYLHIKFCHKSIFT